jgi:hypothetical protein
MDDARGARRSRLRFDAADRASEKSRGDRLVVGAVWLAFVFLPVERFVHQLARVMARSALPRYVLLSSIALIWAWATCRFRGGDGPFHIHNLGIWRGYPFPFEEWGCFPCWREFHWFGLAGDLVLPAAAFFVVLRWLRRSGAPVERQRALLLVVFTIAEIPFTSILDQVTGSDPSVTDYIIEIPAKCPHCFHGILEETLIEPA